MTPPFAASDSLFGDVNDFFDSGTWLLIRNLTLFFVVVFWAATAYWVYKDARRRALRASGGDSRPRWRRPAEGRSVPAS